ncbi:hypothetical protein [Rhizobium terrae]|nr:hypothetical protein [Rhizobium terrae]
MSGSLTRPIVGIEKRTAQDVFDIMVQRFPSRPGTFDPSEGTRLG